MFETVKRSLLARTVASLIPASIVLLGMSISTQVQGQAFTDSNLPIVIINTDGGFEIPDEPRIQGSMRIIYKGAGQRNSLDDSNDPLALNYSGRISIEVRGSSSQSLAKKQYSLTTLLEDNITNNNTSLLGMPKENDWVLNGLAFDASLIRDYLSYYLGRQLGEYAPRTVYCEVIINGDYRGLYLLQEKIKADDNRVNIHKIETTDNTVPEVTGGYITKADKVTPLDPSAWTMPTYLGTVTDFVHEFPKPSVITTTQHIYIQNVFWSLSSRAGNTSIVNGFPSVIDVPSFVDFMLINELGANVDAYQFSTFFHKDRNGKLRAGPLWDLNLTFGNDLTFWGLDRSHTNTWQFDNGDNVGPRFWKDLFNNSTFRCYLSRRFHELTQPGMPLNESTLSGFIDETVIYLSEAIAREQARWGTIGNHAAHIFNMKSWITARLSWLTSSLGSYGACSDIQLPSLVISKINYHPETSPEFPDSGDQEFIEITNAGDTPVDATGFYFLGTGLVYQFPVGTVIPPGGRIQLANDAETFTMKYGYPPFGEYARNLSNDSQQLRLGDAFGNLIDEVQYDDATPWPDADGNGLYIKLAGLTSDNSLPENWVASNEAISTNVVVVGIEEASTSLQVYPNPVSERIFIHSDKMISHVWLLDTQGRIVHEKTLNEKEWSVYVNDLPNSFYTLSVEEGGTIKHYKVAKQ